MSKVPLPYGERIKIKEEDLEKEFNELNKEYFYLFDVEISLPKGEHIPLLPIRIDKGIIFPFFSVIFMLDSKNPGGRKSSLGVTVINE